MKNNYNTGDMFMNESASNQSSGFVCVNSGRIVYETIL